jgi:hypothetical protein
MALLKNFQLKLIRNHKTSLIVSKTKKLFTIKANKITFMIKILS